jgi:hypothetical protein
MIAAIISVVILTISWYIWDAWQEAKKFASIIGRLAPALLELEEFYQLLDLTTQRAHFLERHGPMLTISDVFGRSNSGNIKFSGLSGKPVASARWYKHADLLKAVNSALIYWEKGIRPTGGIFAFHFEEVIGEGYAKKSSILIKTCNALVIIKEGTVITAYPLLDDLKISNPHIEHFTPMRLLLLPLLFPLQLSAQSINLIPATPPVQWLIGAEHANDDRLYLIQQNGYIAIRTPDGAVSPQPFLDWSNRIKLKDEQGLLGLAFHPDYASNGRLYIYYSQKGTGDCVLSRLLRSNANPDLADTTSEQILLSFPHPTSNHVGGSLKFGPDGYLYLSSGDGGELNDPHSNAQNGQLYLGKILRMDVDGGTPYAIPPGNLVENNPAFLPEIWCNGLRNPWRMGFDRMTGDTWIGDVGQSAREEIDFIPKGGSGRNFGWSCVEGSLPFNPCPDTLCCFAPPLYEYAHNNNANCSGSITGGYVYRGYRWNDLWGKYIFTDFCTGVVFALTKSPDSVHVASLGVHTPFDYASIAEDNSGELFIAGYFSNKLYRIESQNCAPVARIASLPDTVYRCENATDTLSLSAYGADVSGMQFQWQINGQDLVDKTTGHLDVHSFQTNADIGVVVTNPTNDCSASSNLIHLAVIPVKHSQIDTVLMNGQLLQGVIILKDTAFARLFSSAAGCDSSVTYSVHAISSSNTPVDRFTLRVFPSPAHDFIALDFGTAEWGAEPDIRIFNSLGQAVRTVSSDLLQYNKGIVHIQIGDLPSGLYTVMAGNGRWAASGRFAKR